MPSRPKRSWILGPHVETLLRLGLVGAGNFRRVPGVLSGKSQTRRRIVMFRRRLIGTIAALVVIAVGSASAGGASGPLDNRPVRFWSFHEVQQGVGDVEVAADSEVGGRLHESFIFGPAVFNFPESNRGAVSRSATSSRPRAASGSRCWPRHRRATSTSAGRRSAAPRTSISFWPTRSDPMPPRCASPSRRRSST